MARIERAGATGNGGRGATIVMLVMTRRKMACGLSTVMFAFGPTADGQGWIAAQRLPFSFSVLVYADTMPGLERGDGK